MVTVKVQDDSEKRKFKVTVEVQDDSESESSGVLYPHMDVHFMEAGL